MNVSRAGSSFCGLSVCSYNTASSTYLVDSILFHVNSTWSWLNCKKKFRFLFWIYSNWYFLSVCEYWNNCRGYNRSSSQSTSLLHFNYIYCLSCCIRTRTLTLHRCKKRNFINLNLHIILFRSFSQAGIYWITFLDQFTGSYPAYIIGFCECICIAYVYGSINPSKYLFFSFLLTKCEF